MEESQEVKDIEHLPSSSSEDEELLQLKSKLEALKMKNKKTKLEEKKEQLRKEIEAEKSRMGKSSIKSSEKDVTNEETNQPHIVKQKEFNADEVAEKLRKIFELVERFLHMPEFDEDLQDELSKVFKDYLNMLESEKRDLLRNDCGIVFAGETSAGKSRMINTIIGKKILSSKNIPATGRVCRVRNSEILQIKCYNKQEELIQEEIIEDEIKMKMRLESLTEINKIKGDESGIYYVDVHFPVPILKGNVILVDTPGKGDAKNLNEVLLNFLPQAVALIFIVNAANAGGVAEDRLLSILEAVTARQMEKTMPCFDKRDVMFVTNKWDLVESDSSSEDEEEDTWKLVNEKIHKYWQTVPEKNIFRVSLKKMSIKRFGEEYRRFEKILHETIEKNKYKRIEFYFRFLKSFTGNAHRGTLARLKLLERSEAEQKKVLEETRKKVTELENKCLEDIRHLQSYKLEIIDVLCVELKAYLHSNSGRDEILNPPRRPPIVKLSLTDRLQDVIPSRIEDGIKRWCSSDKAKHLFGKAEKEVRSKVNALELRIKRIDAELLGLHVEHVAEEPAAASVLLLGIGILALPFSFTIGAVITFLILPFTIVFGWGDDWKRNKANEMYDHIVKKITDDDLRHIFEDSFGKAYSKIIDDVFHKKIPGIIKAQQQTVDTLEEKFSLIREKEKELEILKRMIDQIENETREFEVMYGNLPHI